MGSIEVVKVILTFKTKVSNDWGKPATTMTDFTLACNLQQANTQLHKKKVFV